MMRMNVEKLPKLHEAFGNSFNIGAAVNPITMVTQKELLTHHYNSVTAENEMKFERLHPSEEVYTFEQADQIVSFAKSNGMAVRGHTLVWHNQTPEWVFQNSSGGKAGRELLLARMKAHIDEVVGRYRGDIHAWDVVNEAIADSGSELLRSSRGLLRSGRILSPRHLNTRTRQIRKRCCFITITTNPYPRSGRRFTRSLNH